MYKLKRLQLSFAGDGCHSYSIWDFSPLNRWQEIAQFVGECTPCRLEFFPYIFWLVLGLSFTGAYRCICECVHICCIYNSPISMWRPRKFFVLNCEVLRTARLVGSIVSTYTWLLMIYGLMSVEPLFIRPWLVVNSLMLALDLTVWLIDVITGRIQLRLTAIIPMMWLLITLSLVNCIQTVFKQAIKNKMKDALSVFGKDSILRNLYQNVT